MFLLRFVIQCLLFILMSLFSFMHLIECLMKVRSGEKAPSPKRWSSLCEAEEFASEGDVTPTIVNRI